MKNRIWAFTIPAVILLAVFLVPSLLTSQCAVVDKSSKEDIAHKMQRIQIPFIANSGQLDEQVKFYANTFGGTVFVTKDGEIVYSLPNNSSESGSEAQMAGDGVQKLEGKRQISENRCKKSDSNPQSAIRNPKSGVAITETLVGGKVQEITGNEKAVTKVSYFKGNDPSQWKTSISTYDAVSLGEVYEGIELKLKAYGNNVEKLFYVKPSVNPETIQVKLNGAKALKIDKDGQLEVRTELGPVRFTRPVAYQEIDGKRVEVDVKYSLSNPKSKTCPQLRSGIRNLSSTSIGDPKSEYGFKVASYDKSKELIIDPLLASTYLGGTGNDYGTSIVLDASGNVYVTGYTMSTDFPTTSGVYDNDISHNGGTDVFVSKLDGGLSSLLASTYLGGANYDRGYSIALDASGNVYVTGFTVSSDFPTTSGAYDTSQNSGFIEDVFVSKLDGGLSSLLASTYLGGASYDEGHSISLDASGNVYVAGYTASTNYPTTSGAYDTSFNGGWDVFVSKLDVGLSSLLASTYLGGASSDLGYSIALDASGNVYVTGFTYSTDFPTTGGAYDTPFNGSNDIFVSKLDVGLSSILASTFLGGASYETGYSLVLDASGNVYVTGRTASSDFPTTGGAYDTSSNGGGWDVFVSKLDGGLSGLLASTYLGGAHYDWGYSIALDASGNVYVTGCTYSTDFPTMSGAYDTSFNGGSYYDVFVSKLDGGLSSLLASTYLGGASSDLGYSIALDASGNVYVTGHTYSTNYPTTSGAYDTSQNSGFIEDVFVSKLDAGLSGVDTTPPTVISTSPASGATDVAITSAITVTFSEAMDSSTITTATFSVSDGSSTIGGTVSYSGTTATFTPSSSLSYATTYTATITTGVKDISGNALASDYTWSFTTVSPQDTTPPKIAGAYVHTMALKSDGTVWTWGYNYNGQLGDGTNTDRNTPGQVSSLGEVTAIAGGAQHTVALKSDGTVWTWGNNFHGQLGDGTYTDRTTPAQVSSLSEITAIASGDWYTAALKSDGTVWAWGYNVHGELGDGTTTNRTTPVQVSSLSGVIAIAGGYFHMIALKSDGTVWTWGYNSYGQLGDGTTTDRNTPVQVSGLSGVIAIAGGNEHTVALKSDGTVWTWGFNGYGQLGDETTTNRTTPVQVSSLCGVTAIGGGTQHTIALKSDGTVWTWGWNASGQLGDGTTTQRTTPVQVSGLSGIFAVAGGAYHAIALKSDGTVWTWGWNDFGQLGDGTNTIRTTPVQVNGLNLGTISTSTNTPPMANAGADQSVTVNDTVTLDGGCSADSDGDSLTYSWSFTNTPSGSTATLSDATVVNPTFTIDKAGTYVVSLTVNDGTVDSETDTVTIAVQGTTAPVVSNTTANPNPVAINTACTITAQIDDTASNISYAEYSTDGGIQWYNMDAITDGTNSVNVSVTMSGFTESKLLTVSVRGTNEQGNTSEPESIYLPVYDPSAGFVTGGGWIWSPQGAYVADTSLEGKANFGFVAKYKKGANTPDGNTEFQFKTANLNFHSNTYEWLVVAGHKAMFKGTGTINGEGSYKFIISAIDGSLKDSSTQDKFRIRIWEEDGIGGETTVYDNQMDADMDAEPTTTLGGGSIIIHKVK